MSDRITNFTLDNEEEEDTSKFSLVIRNVQDGKTFICIKSIISDKTNCIHIVVTMNTISSSMQFMSRIREKINSNQIIVFNSQSNSSDECHHAKSLDRIFEIFMEVPIIKVIVCCANTKRMRESLPKLIDRALDSRRTSNKKFKIHIDEAHKYIPENRDSIKLFNSYDNVESIIGYTATPYKIWARTLKTDPLFYKIFIRDVEREYNIVRSTNYFGVKNCECLIYETIISEQNLIENSQIDSIIDEDVIKISNTHSKRSTWYANDYVFNLGNEILLLSFIKYIITQLNISQREFSYNFIPGYTRKATHCEIMKIILDTFENANVIIMNGNGMELWKRYDSDDEYNFIRVMTRDNLLNKITNDEEYKKLLEPSYVIEKMIENEYRNFPTFITGLDCVGMSVTLINETIGNFDNVILFHEHLSSEMLYQLCRFPFNYANWSDENKNKIKTTKIHSYYSSVNEIILDYENNVKKLSTNYVGASYTLRELTGEDEHVPSIRDIKKEELKKINLINDNKKIWKKFAVVDGSDNEQWNKVKELYRSIRGKELNGISMPKKKEDGFYYCSTTGNIKKQLKIDISKIENHSWWSSFQLVQNQFNYARIYVGYDNEDDPTEYTIYVKFAIIEKNEENREIINKYAKKVNSLHIDENENN
jgi:hypothetical protein